MVKAKDLRMGNYITGDNNTLWIVTGTWRDDVIYTRDLNEDEDLEIRNCEDLVKPIPLTEDWLIKFGFEKSIEEFEMSKDITIHNNNGWVKKMVFFQIDEGFCGVSLRDIYDSCKKETYVIEIDIEYVHQLQNLYFALTSQELTIKE